MSNKKSGKKRVVKVVKHSFEGGIDEILSRLTAFSTAWNAKQAELVEKHNTLAKIQQEIEKRQQNIAMFAAQEFGKITAHLQASSNSFNHLDLNVLAVAEVLKEMFGQLAQIDEFLKKLSVARVAGEAVELALSEDEIGKVKTVAIEWFQSVSASAFQKVQARKEAEDKAYAEAEQKAKEEAEKAAKEKQEAVTVEQELLAAAQQDRKVQDVGSGGQGAAIPAGADVFGG